MAITNNPIDSKGASKTKVNLEVKKRFWRLDSRGVAEGSVGPSPPSLEDPEGEQTDRGVEFTKALA